MAKSGDELVNPVTALRSETAFETLAGLARDGKTDAAQRTVTT